MFTVFYECALYTHLTNCEAATGVIIPGIPYIVHTAHSLNQHTVYETTWWDLDRIYGRPTGTRQARTDIELVLTPMFSSRDI